MAKLGKTNHNNRKMRLIKQHAKKRAELKATLYSGELSEEEFRATQRKLQRLPADSNPIRYRNRCEITGRPRAFMRRFKMSRITFREYANFGLLPGVTKSSF